MFHLFKMSRTYIGKPYNGPTSLYQDAAYATLPEAVKAAQKFNKRNPVGWYIFEAESGELVDSVNFLED